MYRDLPPPVSRPALRRSGDQVAANMLSTIGAPQIRNNQPQTNQKINQNTKSGAFVFVVVVAAGVVVIVAAVVVQGVVQSVY